MSCKSVSIFKACASISALVDLSNTNTISVASFSSPAGKDKVTFVSKFSSSCVAVFDLEIAYFTFPIPGTGVPVFVLGSEDSSSSVVASSSLLFSSSERAVVSYVEGSVSSGVVISVVSSGSSVNVGSSGISSTTVSESSVTVGFS